MAISNEFVINPVKKTVTRSREWPGFHLEVCRGHVVRRPWYLRWMWKKRYWHKNQHPTWAGITMLDLYSWLTEEWEKVDDGPSWTEIT